MTQLTDFSLQFIHRQPWLVGLIVVLLLGVAWWAYRRTTPSLAALVRWLLFSVRAVVILTIAALLLQPILGFTRQGDRPARVALLLDRSTSIQRVEAGKSRRSRGDSLLSSLTFAELSKEVSLSRHAFAATTASGSEQPDSNATALGDALRFIRQLEIQPDQILLLSDGRSNTGEDPLRVSSELPPIVAVNLALEESTVDLWVDQIEVNPVGFLGQPMKVKVRLGVQGGIETARGDSVQLTIKDGRRTLGEARVKLDSASGQFVETELSVTPGELGKRLWDVGLSEFPGELSMNNNRKSVAVSILKSRLSVLLVTARPDHEVGFLRRTLLAQEKYEVSLLVTGQKSGNLGKLSIPVSEWTRFDAIVLHDPTPSELARYQESLFQLTATKSVGIWVMLGSRFGAETIQPSLRTFLPALPAGTRARILGQEFTGEPVEAQLFHPTVRLAEQRSEIRERWHVLPPFQQLVLCDSILNRGLITLTTDPSRGLTAPVLVVRRFGQGKILQSNALPFWRFDFGRLNSGQYASQSTGDYPRLTGGIIDWLTLPDEGDPIRFSSERDLFTRGERVRFSGTAFDPGFRPLEQIGGRIVLKSLDSGNTRQLEQPIVSKADGSLSAEISSIAPGDYRYTATVEQEGTTLKTFNGQIRVEPFSAEEYDQSGNPALLSAIAQKSGGRYLTAAQFDEVREAIPTARVVESNSGEFALWGKSWPLFLILGLLATEWVARKVLNLL